MEGKKQIFKLKEKEVLSNERVLKRKGQSGDPTLFDF